MSGPTCASILSGGKIADVGLMAAGYTPMWGVEYDAAIAEVADANIPARTLVQRVQDVRWASLEAPDLLWASPECKEFSNAKAGGIEGPEQLSQAEAICAALRTLRPSCFVLENVTFYRHSQSFALIRATLDKLGYWSAVATINAADHGVPQSRRRLILRAVRHGLVPHLPGPLPWIGWHAAIADLIPSLPDAAFAPWQLSRLPRDLDRHALFAANDSRDQHNRSYGKSSYRTGDAPAFSITHNSPGWWKSFIVDCQGNNGGRGLTIREASAPVFTITASNDKRVSRAWLDGGRVVAMTARALARFQSVPDSYVLPASKMLAARVVGNGVPCKLAEAIGRSLLGVL